MNVGPVISLAIVVVAFAIGTIASVIADRRDPDIEAHAAPSDEPPRFRRQDERS